MTVCQNKDLLSKIRSSYLWKDNEEQSNNVIVSMMVLVSYFFNIKLN